MFRFALIVLVILIVLGSVFFMGREGAQVRPVAPGVEASVESEADAAVDTMGGVSVPASRREVGLSKGSAELAPVIDANGDTDTEAVAQVIVFEGRAVSGTGAFLADAKLDAEWKIIREYSYPVGSEEMDTDSVGRFRFQAPSMNADPGEWTLALDFVHRRPKERKLASSTRLFEKPLDGSIDLGDVVFELQPALVAGRVVDQDGHPIAGARVRGLRKEGDRWRGLAGQECAPSLETGVFELFANVDADEPALALRAVADGYIADTRQSVLPGDMSVLLTLEQAGAIEGNLTIDEALSGLVFETFIQPVDPAVWDDFAPMDYDGGGDRVGDWWLGTVGPEGEIFWRGLRSGKYRVKVTAGEPAITVGEWDGLVVRAGETTRDPRMQALDPKAQLSLVELEVVDVAGAAISSVHYWSVTAGVPSPWYKGLPEWNHMALPEVGATELVVSAPGYLDRKVRLQSSSMRVVLAAAPVVTLALPSDFDIDTLVPLTAALLRPCAGPTGWEYMEGVPKLKFDSREVEFASSWQGSVRIDVSAKLPWRSTTLNIPLRLAEGGYYIDIGTAANQRFELPVTDEVIDAARARLAAGD